MRRLCNLRGHGDVLAKAATKRHVWACGPAAAGVSVKVYGPSYHQKPIRCPWSGLPPETMVISSHCAELALHLTCEEWESWHTQRHTDTHTHGSEEWERKREREREPIILTSYS